VAFLIAVGVLVWWAWPQKEQTYQGKPLSFWIDQYQAHLLARGDSEPALKRNQAQAAIREIGTNALPALLAMVSKKDSPLKSRLLTLARKQSFIKFRLNNDDYYHARSSYGFGALGPIAKPAVPALIELLHDKNPRVRACAAHSLGMIGPDAESAIPALLPLLDERNEGIPILESMWTLGVIHKRPEIVIPALLQFLNGERKDWNYATPALDALSWFREEARFAVPVIEEYLHDSDVSKRDAALNALNRIDPEAAAKAARSMAEPR
jgi:HEAT repeat protein